MKILKPFMAVLRGQGIRCIILYINDILLIVDSELTLTSNWGGDQPSQTPGISDQLGEIISHSPTNYLIPCRLDLNDTPPPGSAYNGIASK
jgi:hypothetical protein